MRQALSRKWAYIAVWDEPYFGVIVRRVSVLIFAVGEREGANRPDTYNKEMVGSSTGGRGQHPSTS